MIQDVLDTLKAFEDPKQYAVERATAMRDVRKILMAYKTGAFPPDPRYPTRPLRLDHPLAAGDKIQIVGHGGVGLLWLGGYWLETEDFALQPAEVFLIDSDYGGYGMMVDCMPQACEVRLIGCAVGADMVAGDVRIADGATLLFDLARMWNCDVGASKDYVQSTDFVSGLFDDWKPGRLRFASEVDYRSPAPVMPPHSFRANEGRTRMEITNVRDAPIIRRFGLPDSSTEVNDHLRRVSRLVGRQVDASRLLAGPELVVDVSLGVHGKARGEVIANFTLLRVRRPLGGGRFDTRYFEFDPTKRQELLAEVLAIVKLLTA